ncbi:UvrD-helicase domain-containing protein [Cellulomonas soli]
MKNLVGSLRERARVLDLVADYRARKRAQDVLDFGDQVALAARLARDVPEVGAGERARFRVVLLDEYQDTSYAQLDVAVLAVRRRSPGDRRGRPAPVDLRLAGASAGGLERFPEQFRTLDADGTPRRADVHTLSTSWRNELTILDAANLVAGPLRAGARVPLPVLQARPGAQAGHVQALVADTVEDEARAVARFVADRWRGPRLVSTGSLPRCCAASARSSPC